MKSRIDKMHAEAFADDLLAQQRSAGSTHHLKLFQVIKQLIRLRPIRHESSRNPFVSPAAPAWEVMHRDTDTSNNKSERSRS